LTEEIVVGRVEGKVVLISGASRAGGQGLAEAQLLAREGARVVLGDIRDSDGEAAAQSIRDAGGEAFYVHLDVTSGDDWTAAVASAEERYGALHGLVNNAGIFTLSDWEACTVEEMNLATGVNVIGAFNGIKAALPAMRRAGSGSIVNTSSTVVNGGQPGIVAYQMTKAAILGLTRSAAASFGAEAIRVNAICPGLIFTPMVDDAAVEGGFDPSSYESSSQVLTMRATGDDVAPLVLYLISDEARYHTGDVLNVDGGMSMGA
jgi:3alpha(or 20beta)-hydroxysteroid dehydrogenase